MLGWIRLDAAKAAAHYVHPKLASIRRASTDGGRIVTKVIILPAKEPSAVMPPADSAPCSATRV